MQDLFTQKCMKCKWRLVLLLLYPFFVQELLKWQKLSLFKENNLLFSVTWFSHSILSFTCCLNQSLRATFLLVPTNQIQDGKKRNTNDFKGRTSTAYYTQVKKSHDRLTASLMTSIYTIIFKVPQVQHFKPCHSDMKQNQRSNPLSCNWQQNCKIIVKSCIVSNQLMRKQDAKQTRSWKSNVSGRQTRKNFMKMQTPTSQGEEISTTAKFI